MRSALAYFLCKWGSVKKTRRIGDEKNAVVANSRKRTKRQCEMGNDSSINRIVALRGLDFGEEAEAATMSENDYDTAKPVATLDFAFGSISHAMMAAKAKTLTESIPRFFPHEA
jgi:hypothetical protein